MKAYSTDLRQKVVDAYRRGEGSMRQLAARFAVSLDFVWRLLTRYRHTHGVAPKPHGGGIPRKLKRSQEDLLLALVKADPAATLAELNQQFKDRTGVVVSDATISLTLRRRGITRKKLSYHASERDARSRTRKARQQFHDAQPDLDPQRLIFIDEAGVNLGMARHYGRSPSGCRAQADKPYHADPPLTLVGALSLDGVGAFMELEGAIDGHAFLGFVEQLLIPTLRPGDQVWLDNLSSHRVEGIQEAIEAQQAELHFLPPYSPEYSPIELLWAKLKAWLRGAAARTQEALDGELLNALDDITEKDIKGWFKHCGFRTEPG